MRTACILSGLFIFFNAQTTAQEVAFYPNYHSIGFEVLIPPGFDTDGNGYCFFEYKKSAENQWLQGFPATRIVLNGIEQFRGSLFNLEPETVYDIDIKLVDSFPVFMEINIPTQTLSTRKEPEILITDKVFWVSPDGTGNAYTMNHPGDLKTLLNGGLECGSTVYLKGGSYFVGNIQLNLQTSCDAETPINILAAPGEIPVLDGGYYETLNWQSTNDPLRFVANIPDECQFTALCLLDGKRLYPYPSYLQNLLVGLYYLHAMNLNYDGFTRDLDFINIKTFEGVNPLEVPVVLSREYSALWVNGNNHDIHLMIDGITFKNYGKASLSGTLSYPSICLRIHEANYVTIQNCTFEFNTNALIVDGGSSFTTIQNNNFIDQTGWWSHAMLKKSVTDQNPLVWESRGRQLENAGIKYEVGTNGNRQLVIRNNFIDGLANGIAASTLPDRGIMEADIYNNTLLNTFDAIEVDGNWTNLRVWNNEAGYTLAGISMAPPLNGPVYVYRNVFHHILSRHNVQNDPYLNACEPPTEYISQGQGIKTNGGGTSAIASDLYIFNNTFHSEDTLGYNVYSYDDEWGSIRLINNIFYSENNVLLHFNALLNDSSYQWNSQNDNYFVANGNPTGIVKEVHGQYICHEAYTVSELENLMKTISNSPYIDFQGSFEVNPLFVHAESDSFQLQSSSPLIDAGKIIPGFHDFEGDFPDVGAKEFFAPSGTRTPSEEADILIFPNPTSNGFFIKINSNTPSEWLNLKVYDANGRLVLFENHENLYAKDIIPVSGANLPTGIYFLNLQYENRVVIEKLIIIRE